MAATGAAKQVIWIKELLSRILSEECEKSKLRSDNKSTIALTNSHVFHGKSKHILSKKHFIRECVDNEQIEEEDVSEVKQNCGYPYQTVSKKSSRK